MKTIWTKDRCLEQALKFETKKDFINGSPSAYTKALRNKWIDEICSHMNKVRKPKDYWTKERCQEEAFKYKSRSEFNKDSTSAYSKAWDNGWLEEICKHMTHIGNKYKRCVYVYEFPDKNAYVGLTFNINNRIKQHSKRGPVFEYIKSSNLNPDIRKLTDYINVEDAKIKEHEFVDFYKQNGWKLLNTAKTGACGGGDRKWTKDKCKEESLKYNNVKDYKNNSLSYRAAVRNKWLDEVCSHMSRKKNSFNYWTKEKCREEALKFEKRKKFELSFPGAYAACRKNGWLDEVCEHMKSKDIKPKGYWTKLRCKEESMKYNTKSEFQKGSKSSYQISCRNGWLDEICSHMSI